MFENFITFIVVLLIYITYQPSQAPEISLLQAASGSAMLSAGFALLCAWRFRRLQIQARLMTVDFGRLDARFTAATGQMKILAVVLFALDVYLFHLPAFFVDVPLHQAVPTVTALLFLLLFAAHLALVWALGYPVYRRLYAPGLGRRAFILSNLALVAPMLLPWLVLSLLVDLINALPFDGLRAVMHSTEGQVAAFLVLLVAITVFSPALIRTFWRCRPLEAGAFRDRIEAMCRRAGLAYADILQWPIFGGNMITAAVMGLYHRFRYILVTGGLRRSLTDRETDAVIAHEIGHVKRRHLLFYLMFFAGYMVFAFAASNVIILSIYYLSPVNGLVSRGQSDPSVIFSLVESATAIALFVFYFRFVFGYFMRNFERQADLYVYRMFDSARPLISTFEKIARGSGQRADKPNWHHFSIAQRIDYLERCEADRTWVDRHDAKVRRSIAVYLVVLAAVGIVGYQLNFGAAGRQFNAHLLEQVVRSELARSPQDPHLLAQLGDVLYSRNQYADAIAAYRRSLAIDARQSEVLNNLAWLFATCDAPEYRDPPRALELALRAARLSPKAHVLDTLAEAYFVNGRFAQALDAGRTALAAADDRKPYYRLQVEKFQKALDAHRSAGPVQSL